jgi:hypothetical protein
MLTGRRPTLFWVIVATTVGQVSTACNQPATQIHASVRYDDSFGLTSLLVNANGETRAADALHELTISVPDSWADQTIGFEIAGMVATDKRAYGKLNVTPKLDNTIDVEITLQPLQCTQPCTAGTKRCEGNGVATCLVVDTCSVWSQPVACEAPTPFCSDGSCATTCSDECSNGATVCDGTAAVKSCGLSDDDSCLDWKSTACPANQPCSAGVCSGAMMCDNPLPNWKKENPTTVPPPRTGHAMVYDSERQQVVMFGGSDSSYLGDTWTWNGTNWKRESPENSPSGRHLHGMAYDAMRKQVVMFAGYNGSERNDTWTWDGTDWQQRGSADLPVPRRGISMAYDSDRGQVVFFGGLLGIQNFADTWQWDGLNWQALGSTTRPYQRGNYAMAYDAARRKTVLFGGQYDGINSSGIFGDTWTWDGTDWKLESQTGSPGDRAGHAMAYDAQMQRVVMFGASSDTKTWLWNGTNWRREATVITPSARDGLAMAYDAQRKKIVMFGGQDGQALNDTWTLEWSCP